ncbi:hypothetical protein IT774_13940 [Salinimonas marina]|uniref:Uncharacterized protein n=1 Tax=Salinimonas marina TaxID=2785918 RepID=A0A7S9HCI4_9ALTE|nr:hypothetical protein [Salinimonas marina]QPG05210.1 hypothetical protein IT774_13940 [Salinimonas marina]
MRTFNLQQGKLKSMKNIIKSALLATLFCTSFSSMASSKMAKGTYVPVKGTVETFEVSDPSLGEAPEQLGTYKIELVNKDWKSLSGQERKTTRHKIKVEGLLVGKFNPMTGLASHKLVGEDRDYTLRSENDVLIPQSGDFFCSGGTPLVINEHINLVKGTGRYSNLHTGTIVLTGVVNNCPGTEGFGENNLKIVAHEGSVTFD